MRRITKRVFNEEARARIALVVCRAVAGLVGVLAGLAARAVEWLGGVNISVTSEEPGRSTSVDPRQFVGVIESDWDGELFLKVER